MLLAPDDTFKIIEGMKIPPEPYILRKLNKLIQQDEPNIQEVAGLIAQDIGISALVLRTINSALFGMRSKVQSIQHATNLLGVNNIVNIVCGVHLKQSLESDENEVTRNFWESQSNIAMIGASISHTIAEMDADEIYIVGLFHDAGHALLVNHFSDYRELLENHLNDEAAQITEIEDQRYNTNHATIGYFLALSWGLDRRLARVIRDHHRTLERLDENYSESSDEQTMLAVLKMSEHIDKCFWGIHDYEWLSIGQPVLEFLGLSYPDYEEIKLDILDKLNGG